MKFLINSNKNDFLCEIKIVFYSNKSFTEFNQVSFIQSIHFLFYNFHGQIKSFLIYNLCLIILFPYTKIRNFIATSYVMDVA